MHCNSVRFFLLLLRKRCRLTLLRSRNLYAAVARNVFGTRHAKGGKIFTAPSKHNLLFANEKKDITIP